MKRISLTLLAILAAATSGLAQQPNYEVLKISPAVIRTPVFNFQGDQRRTGQSEQWLEVEVEFMAKPEWTEELTFKYYILLGTKLLTGEVTHINIPKGRDLNSVMYVPPRNLMRIMEGRPFTSASIVNVGVQILNKGQLVAERSFKASNGQWWQTMQQVTGLVLNKNETPFAPLYWDRYEAIKSATR